MLSSPVDLPLHSSLTLKQEPAVLELSLEEFLSSLKSLEKTYLKNNSTSIDDLTWFSCLALLQLFYRSSPPLAQTPLLLLGGSVFSSIYLRGLQCTFPVVLTVALDEKCNRYNINLTYKISAEINIPCGAKCTVIAKRWLTTSFPLLCKITRLDNGEMMVKSVTPNFPYLKFNPLKTALTLTDERTTTFEISGC